MRNFPFKEIREFFWKFLVTFFLYLSYFAEGRSYIELNFGRYVVGFVDGVVLCISCFVLVLYLTEQRKGKDDKSKSISNAMQMDIDPKFIHLTVHYSQRTDTPDTLNPARPRYVVNNRTKQAYWIPTWLERFVKQHRLSWNSHDGEKALRSYLKESKIAIHNDNPLPADIGLGEWVISNT